MPFSAIKHGQTGNYAKRAIIHLRLRSFYNSHTKHNMETKLTSGDFCHGVTEGSRSSWLHILGNQLINSSPYYLLYNTTWILY